MLTSLVSDKDTGSKTWGWGMGLAIVLGKPLDPGRCAVPREILLAREPSCRIRRLERGTAIGGGMGTGDAGAFSRGRCEFGWLLIFAHLY